MSVTSLCIVDVIDEFTTIRSGLAELLTRLDQLESLVRTMGNIPGSTDAAAAVDPEFEHATFAGVTARHEHRPVILSDETSETKIEFTNIWSDPLASNFSDEQTANVDASRHASLKPADNAPSTGTGGTHSCGGRRHC